MPIPTPPPTNNPPPKSTSSNPWLIVLLTTAPLPQEAHDYLEERLDPVPYPEEKKEEFEKWTPTPSNLKYIAKQSPHIDSQANLYALAIKVHRTGRDGCVVVDELSKRQLTDTCHHGETKQPTLVFISIYEDLSARHGISIWARRDTAKYETVRRMFTRSKYRRERMAVVVPGVDPSTEAVSERELWADPGLELRDPERGLFEMRELGSSSLSEIKDGAEVEIQTGWDEHIQAITDALWNSRLPREIIDQIVSECDSGPGTGILGPLVRDPRIPMWKYLPSDDHLVIFLLFPTTEDAFNRTKQAVRSALHENVPSVSFELIRLEDHRLKSRRDIMSFWIEYHRHYVAFRKMGYPPLHLLLEPIHDHNDNGFDLSTPSFVEIISRYRSTACASRTTLGKIINTHGDRLRILHYPALQKENISHPDLPFYYTSAPWQTTGQWTRKWSPAFYLTNQLSEDEDADIREEIRLPFGRDSRGWTDKQCGFIKWDREEDGGVEDIWDIVKRVHSEGLFGRGYEIFFCIDLQSSLDSTVILVVPQYWNPGKRWDKVKDLPCPRLVGFDYGRMLGRIAHSEGCYAKFEGMVRHDFKRFLRSDIPVRHVRPDVFDDMDGSLEAGDLWGVLDI
ncbi:hypothetical protein N7478_005634 [Penicillium angulare]|uniref:uncharacterized protein n=1 Tax=Penicillium angulare TaxID=116970 RepID=UPI002541A736|nr:uncharacterized protein N7478_005634 [Penicillium angulare]KAJ5280262.1 hypothetical protein N7478_005634 [Penicillium angulare]